jgi:hypothetical protein
MPTAKPRVQVTLTETQFDLLRRLAKLQHRSMSAVLSELFETIEPVMTRVAVVLEAAVRAQSSALNGLRSATESAQAEVEPMLTAALGQLDLLAAAAGIDQGGLAPKAGGLGASPPLSRPNAVARTTPPALTGGSGTAHTHRRASKRAIAGRGTVHKTSKAKVANGRRK